MIDSEYYPENYKTFKISIGTKIKNPEMLNFIPDRLKTRQMCRNTVKKLPFHKVCSWDIKDSRNM